MSEIVAKMIPQSAKEFSRENLIFFRTLKMKLMIPMINLNTKFLRLAI